ncbi:putative tenascin-N-like [Apostichopus japonicus]|uniref:Putative tenascin-N-like n=1 Tax=Stichopus japonicus TaxID=307972 RepID=A0A2G8K0J0_STIJA|nr:putative tenascin-N-like [Apostichopus japonicus]
MGRRMPLGLTGTCINVTILYNIRDRWSGIPLEGSWVTVPASSFNEGDGAFTYHRNMSFSTIDADHDESQSNCAATQRGGGGGWWFNSCDQTNLNGRYGLDDDTGGIEWNSMPGGYFALKFTEMKIRP